MHLDDDYFLCDVAVFNCVILLAVDWFSFCIFYGLFFFLLKKTLAALWLLTFGLYFCIFIAKHFIAVLIIAALLTALSRSEYKTIMLLPNIDS